MRALQQLCAESVECDLASIDFDCGHNLGGEHLLQFESSDVQGAAGLNCKQGRKIQPAAELEFELEELDSEVKMRYQGRLAGCRVNHSTISPVDSWSAARSNWNTQLGTTPGTAIAAGSRIAPEAASAATQ